MYDHDMDLLKEAGIVVILPPYSPDYNPIELVFGYIKAYLKHHDELLQTLSDPLPVIKAAFESTVVSRKFATPCA